MRGMYNKAIPELYNDGSQEHNKIAYQPINVKLGTSYISVNAFIFILLMLRLARAMFLQSAIFYCQLLMQ